MAFTQVLIDAVTAALPSPPLPPPIYIPPPVDRGDDILETEMPPRKSTLDAEARRRWIGEVGYSIRDTWVDPVEAVPEIVPMSLGEVNTKRVDLLMKDRTAHQDTILIVEEEAYAAREAWAHSIKLSQAVYSKLQTHHEQMQQAEIAELRETDRRHQAQMPRRARRPGEDARVPDHQDAPRDADSHI
nr:hypothetical protein [Tanacetum cinerariifolium]